MEEVQGRNVRNAGSGCDESDLILELVCEYFQGRELKMKSTINWPTVHKDRENDLTNRGCAIAPVSFQRKE